MVFDLGYATWVVDPEGATVRKIVDADPESHLGRGQYGHYADVSPDGSRIVYSTCEYTYYDHDAVGWRYNLGYELAAVNVDGSDLQRLTDNLHFENYPVWSPDGTRIAFIAHNDYSRLADYDYILLPDHYDPHNSEIFTRAADGRDERIVPNTKGVGLCPPVWSPDGERLAFTAHRGQGTSVLARYAVSERLERILYTVRLDGSELSRIGTATTLPTWSPDGERVAFGLEDGVYTVRFDGTDLREVLDDVRANDVSWSPDGTQLLLASGGGVRAVRPDGSDLRRLGPRIRTTAATWSPDGSMIAASRQDTDRYVGTWTSLVFIMDRDGTNVRFLAQGFLEENVYESVPKIVPIKLPPIDPATCSNGVAVAQPEARPGLVEDCRVLIRSRNAFGPRAPSDWTTDTPISKWPGIVVRGEPPRVRELWLRYGAVTGAIPPDIGKLTMLEELRLYGNSLLIGPIPPELGNLTMLRGLHLYNNNLSGPIPPELGNLTMLTHLNLSNNDLNGPVPPDLGNLTMLEKFDISLNPLSVSGCIPVSLSHLWYDKDWIKICQP